MQWILASLFRRFGLQIGLRTYTEPGNRLVKLINRWNQLDQRTVGAPNIIIVFKINKIRETRMDRSAKP